MTACCVFKMIKQLENSGFSDELRWWSSGLVERCRVIRVIRDVCVIDVEIVSTIGRKVVMSKFLCELIHFLPQGFSSITRASII